jgi:1-acyl-sn-glycerol-3-phosphate acyltransferase
MSSSRRSRPSSPSRQTVRSSRTVRAADVTVDHWGRSHGPDVGPFRALYKHWFRVEWTGLEHVPLRGGALLVANHAGVMPVDGTIISLGIEHERGRRVYSLAHHGFWRVPFMGTMLSRFGGVMGHPDNAHRLLADDESLVLVFPEGAKGPGKSPSERHRLQRFGRGGFVETALRAGVPIVPIAIMGTEETTPTLASFRIAGQDVPLSLNTLLFGPFLGPFAPFPAKIRAQVLPPIYFDEEPEGQNGYPRSLLMDRAEAIRGQIQTALNRMLLKRSSVLWG